MKENELVAYHIHAMILNFYISHRRFPIENGYNMVIVFPFCKENALNDEQRIGKEEEV